LDAIDSYHWAHDVINRNRVGKLRIQCEGGCVYLKNQQNKGMKRYGKIIFLMSFVFACNAQTEQSALQSGSSETPISIENLQKASFQDQISDYPQVVNLPEAINFRHASRLIVPAVVHVISTHETYRTDERYQIPDFFRDFFGEHWFRDFDPNIPPQPSRSGGSGVIITSDGYIVTNNHVVSSADEIEVTLYDRRSYKVKVIGTDPSTDLALLKIDEKGLSILKLGDSDKVEVGDWVLAGGNPFNLSSTVTAGIISAKARNINILMDQQSIESFLQTDAALNPGNSGGALVNVQGELIGITSAIATPTGSYAGYSFAIPVNMVKKVIDDLLNYGVVQRGFLGITIRDMNSELAQRLGIKRTTGVYIDSVMKGSAAEDAGIRPNDIIISIDGNDVGTSPQLQEIVSEHRPGDVLNIKVQRKNDLKTMKVTLKNIKGTTDVVAKESKDIDIMSVLGVELAELTRDEKKALNLTGGVKVVAINAGLIRQNTDVKKGFIIVKVNNERIATIDDFINAIENRKGGIMLEGFYLSNPQTLHYYAFGLE
jgi:serine protease Do